MKVSETRSSTPIRHARQPLWMSASLSLIPRISRLPPQPIVVMRPPHTNAQKMPIFQVEPTRTKCEKLSLEPAVKKN